MIAMPLYCTSEKDDLRKEYDAIVKQTHSAAQIPETVVGANIITVDDPIRQDDLSAEENRERLIACYRGALDEAAGINAKTVVFPLISSGAFCKDCVREYACAAISGFLSEKDEYGDIEVDLYLPDADAYTSRAVDYNDILEYELKELFFEKKTPDKPNTAGNSGKIFILPSGEEDDNVLYMARAMDIPQDVFDGNKENTFYSVLTRFMRDKNITAPDCYNPVNMSKQTFSNIARPDSNPEKKNVLLLALSMRLSLAETEKLLYAAGYTFRETPEDIVLKYCIENRTEDEPINDTLITIYDTLEARGCSTKLFDQRSRENKKDFSLTDPKGDIR